MDFRDTGQKTSGTAVYPVHAQQTSGLLTRCEPLLDVNKFKRLFLTGIPLRLRTGGFITDQDIKERLNWAMNEAELMIGSTLTREAFMHKVPFDYPLYKSYIHVMAEKVQS